MNFVQRNFLLDFLHKRSNVLVGIPSIDAGERSQAKRFQSIRESEIVPSPDLLLMWIRWPAVQRGADYLLLDIDEPCRLQHLPRCMLILDRLVETVGGFLQVVVPLDEIRVSGKSSIVAARLQVNFDLFYPSNAGLEMSADDQH